MRYFTLALLAFALGCPTTRTIPADIPALPPIQGWGSQAAPGTTLYRVTSASSANEPGTLQDALSEPGRYILIDLPPGEYPARQVQVYQPRTTIDCRSAPGVVWTEGRWMLMADDTIVIGCRIAPGQPSTEKLDCLEIYGGSRIAIIHVSCRDYGDEGISIGAADAGRYVRDVTLQNVFIHSPREGSSGAMLLSGGYDRVTLLDVLSVGNSDRNPQLVWGYHRAGTGHVEIVRWLAWDLIYGTRFRADTSAGTLKLALIQPEYINRTGQPTSVKVPIDYLAYHPGQAGRALVYVADPHCWQRAEGAPACDCVQDGVSNAGCSYPTVPEGITSKSWDLVDLEATRADRIWGAGALPADAVDLAAKGSLP